MKITFVRPVYQMEEDQFNVEIPLGLLSLATILSNEGHEAKIIDLQMLLVKNLLTSGDDYYHKCGQKIVQDSPDVIGFTAMCNSYPASILLAKECRRLLPHATILFGGPQATFVDVETLREFNWIDAIVCGEGERAILDLIQALETDQGLQNITGVTYREKDGQILRNRSQEYIEDLDTLPIPDYSLLDYCEDYFKYKRSISLDVGRGCPYNCRYCSTSLLWRRQFRIKSPERIVDEIKELHEKYGVKTVKLTHDLFTVKKELALRFCQLMKENCPQVTWACSARTSTIDDEILDEFSRAGCDMIFYGIESGSPKVLQYFRKDMDLEHTLNVVKATLQRKIKTMTSFIFGAPIEDEESLNQTLMLGLKFKVMGSDTVQMHQLIPESGTDVFCENRDQLFLGDKIGEQSKQFGKQQSELELNLVKKYPHIFSSFYTIQIKKFSPVFLREIEMSFSRVLNSFARTIFVILAEKGWKPLDLFKDWYQWQVEKSWRKQQLERREIIQLFAKYVRGKIAQDEFNTPYLQDLLSYEETFWEIGERNYLVDKSPCRDQIVSDDYLLLSSECALGHYSYDIPVIIENLKDLELPSTAKKEVFMIFRYLGTVNTKSIIANQFTYDLLNGCSKKIQLNVLIESMLQKWGHVNDHVEADVNHALGQLIQNRFINIVR